MTSYYFVLRNLSGHTGKLIFRSMDLAWGYWQVDISYHGPCLGILASWYFVAWTLPGDAGKLVFSWYFVPWTLPGDIGKWLLQCTCTLSILFVLFMNTILDYLHISIEKSYMSMCTMCDTIHEKMNKTILKSPSNLNAMPCLCETHIICKMSHKIQYLASYETEELNICHLNFLRMFVLAF